MQSFSGVGLLSLTIKGVKPKWILITIQYNKKRRAKGKENKMGMKFYSIAIALVLLLASAAEFAEAAMYDVTKYGGKADGSTDLSKVRELFN